MAKLKQINVFLRGGLGNQLFQYATGLSISRKFDKNLVLRADLLPLAEDKIGGVSRWPNQISGFRHSGTIRSVSNQPNGKTNVAGKVMHLLRMVGDLDSRILMNMGWLSAENKSTKRPSNFESIKFINSYSPFKDLVAESRKQLSHELNNVVEPTAQFLKLSAEIIEMPTTVVHIRQGDYLNLENIYGASTTDYFTQALAEVALTSKTQRVWLFTDSPDKIQDSILAIVGPERIIGPADLDRPIENLVLMSKGSAIVAANSSFSWWACFIADDKTVVISPNILNAEFNNFENENEPLKHWKFINVN